MSCIGGVDAKVGGQFHRAAHAFRNVDERTVTEYSRIQCSIKIVALRHHAAEVSAHQVGMILNSLGKRTKNDTGFGELLFERRRNRNAVKHGINSDTGEACALVQGDAELVVSFEQLRVDFIQTFGSIVVRLGGGKIRDRVKVDRRVMDVSPVRFFHGPPLLIGAQAPLEHEFGLVFARRNRTHDLFVKAGRKALRCNIGNKTVLVATTDDAFDVFGFRGHGLRSFAPFGRARRQIENPARDCSRAASRAG